MSLIDTLDAPKVERPKVGPQADASAGDTSRQAPGRDDPPGWMLAVVLLAGLVVRLAVAAWLNGEALYVHDERDYDTLALNIVRYGEFSFQPGALVSLRPPLFPGIVAGLYALTGEQNYTAVRVFNAFAGTLTIYVVYLLARRMYDGRVALLAAAICALYPSLVVTSGLVLTETLFTLLVCSSCLFMERYLSTARAGWLAAFGISLGIGALTRSILWLFPGPVVLFLFLFSPERRWLYRLGHVAVAVVAFAAVLAPWTIRNTRLQKTFITVDVMGGRNFMMGNYEFTPLDRPWAAIEIEGERSWHHVLRAKYSEESKGVTQGQLDKLAMRYALEYIAAHPGQSLLRAAAKFGHFWQLEREVIAGLMRGYWGGLSKPGILVAAALIIGVYVGVMLLCMFGAASAPASGWRMHLFVLLLIGFVCGIHTLAFGHSRYHLPLMPIIGVYAAAAVMNGRQILSHWRQPRICCAALVCAGLMALWCHEIVVEAVRF